MGALLFLSPAKPNPPKVPSSVPGPPSKGTMFFLCRRSVVHVCRRHASTSATASASAAPSSSSVIKKVQPHAFQAFDILFLGSGGSNPSRARGMPCVMLDLGGEMWMFDVGEGSVRQSINVRTCMDATRIFITHMHADHIFGLPGILVHAGMRPKRVEDNGEVVPPPPLHIYGPYGAF